MSKTFQAIRESVSDGKLFSVTFVKKDGSIRFMTCRTGVKKYRKTLHEIIKTGCDTSLITVFDMQKKEYRSFHQESVLALKMKGQTFNVIYD